MKSRVFAAMEEVVTKEYTINVHMWLPGCTFKKMAPKTINERRKFLNKHIWSRGIHGVPRRVRVQALFSCHCCQDPTRGLEGLDTTIIDEAD
ncbi:hypothetical protein AMTRI_Chr13g88530 [Amborella trichopoda]